MILVFELNENDESETVEISFYTVSNFRNETIYHSDPINESVMKRISESENVTVKVRLLTEGGDK